MIKYFTLDGVPLFEIVINWHQVQTIIYNIDRFIFLPCFSIYFCCCSWEIDITFCTIYTITSRATWAVFPYTIISICSLGLFKRATKIFIVRKVSEDEEDAIPVTTSKLQQSSKFSSQDSKSFDDGSQVELDDDDDDWEREGFTAMQKTLLAFIWFSSLIYSMMSNVILTKKRDVKCSVRSDLEIMFNLVSIITVIAIPIVCICLWFIAHVVLSVCALIKKCVVSDTQSSQARDQRYLSKKRKKSSSIWLEIVIILCFVIVFLAVYPSSMYITETYFANTKTIFPFMLIKYCVGSLQLVISPLCILLVKRDIRKGVKISYTKGSTQNDETELTFEELQEHLGIGVNVNN